MERPHVFQRCRPRGGRRAQHEAADPQLTARKISIALGAMIDRADDAGLGFLGDLLEAARLEAEHIVTG